jgi:chondroitin 4-sulfotransferase 11
MYNFIHIPKNAGLSFENIIKKHSDKIIYSGHTRVTDIQPIAFIRHPYDRLLSAYFYLISGGRQYPSDLIDQEILQAYSGFKDFVLHIGSDDLMNKIIHIKPMHYWLCDDQNNIIVNKIFKIENIADIDKFLSELGIEEKLSDTFTNKTYHDHYTEYLDAEVIAELNNLYALDFELFGYKKL